MSPCFSDLIVPKLNLICTTSLFSIQQIVCENHVKSNIHQFLVETMGSEQFLKLMDSCWQSHCNQMASFKHCIHIDSETSLQFGRLELHSLRKNLTGRDCFVIFYFSIEVPLAKLDDGCIGYLLATGSQSLCNVIMETLNGLCKHDMNF